MGKMCPGLIRDESMFDIRSRSKRNDPDLRMATNIVYITTFDDRKSASQISMPFQQRGQRKAAADPTFISLEVLMSLHKVRK